MCRRVREKVRQTHTRARSERSLSEAGTAACCFLRSCLATGQSAGRGMAGTAELHLRAIRRFRDKVLGQSALGRLAIWLYYYVLSPTVVLLVRHSGRLRKFMGQKFTPLLARFCRSVEEGT